MGVYIGNEPWSSAMEDWRKEIISGPGKGMTKDMNDYYILGREKKPNFL